MGEPLRELFGNMHPHAAEDAILLSPPFDAIDRYDDLLPEKPEHGNEEGIADIIEVNDVEVPETTANRGNERMADGREAFRFYGREIFEVNVLPHLRPAPAKSAAVDDDLVPAFRKLSGGDVGIRFKTAVVGRNAPYAQYRNLPRSHYISERLESNVFYGLHRWSWRFGLEKRRRHRFDIAIHSGKADNLPRNLVSIRISLVRDMIDTAQTIFDKIIH